MYEGNKQRFFLALLLFDLLKLDRRLVFHSVHLSRASLSRAMNPGTRLRKIKHESETANENSTGNNEFRVRRERNIAAISRYRSFSLSLSYARPIIREKLRAGRLYCWHGRARVDSMTKIVLNWT